MDQLHAVGIHDREEARLAQRSERQSGVGAQEPLEACARAGSGTRRDNGRSTSARRRGSARRLNVDDDGTMTSGRNKAAEALGIEPKTIQKALHDRLGKRWGILEAAPSSNGKFTVIKFRNWDRYRPFYQNHQHGSTKTGDLSTIMVPQYNEADLRTPVPQKPVSVPPSGSTIKSSISSTKDSLGIDDPVPQSGTESVPQNGSIVLKGAKENVEEKINNNSSYEELQRLAAEALGGIEAQHVESNQNDSANPEESKVLEGVVVKMGKNGKLVKSRREANEDGTWGDLSSTRV
jgi:hypothetical protein